MMQKFKINPFDRAALTQVKLLAGRVNELQQIRFILRSASMHENRIKSLLITGPRGVGKTSFLNLIEQECSLYKIIPCRINLTEANSINSHEYFWHMFNQLLDKLFKHGLFGGEGGEIDLAIRSILYKEGIQDQANWIFRTPIIRKNYSVNPNVTFEVDLFIADLNLIRQELKQLSDNKKNENYKILFLVDESQLIYSNKQIVEEIRYIIQQQNLGVGFVFAGDTSYSNSLWEVVFGGTYRDFEIISLNYFDQVEAVADYFKKSLGSIGWTTEEIEETLFYKFGHACRKIYYLTSGKPAWINTIASKMFERCMKRETPNLRFDNQALNDIKKLLNDSGQIDTTKLDFIESLPTKYRKALSALFACELYSFNQVYFYHKFTLSEDNFITLKEFEEFCKVLVEKGIISVISKNTSSKIGFNFKNEKVDDFINQHYFSFEPEGSDSIKQWLQISSDGYYSFLLASPDYLFINNINKRLIYDNEIKRINVLTDKSRNEEESTIRLREMINSINSNSFNAEIFDFGALKLLYRICKIIGNSTDKQALYVKLIDEKAGVSREWNICNYDDNDHLLRYYESKALIDKFISSVERFKSEDHNFKLEISIDQISKPSLESLQKAIIKTGDKKKLGIILDDKMEDLIRAYIKDSNIKDSEANANFFYELFIEGHDLDLRFLNNSAYVYLANEDLIKAEQLLMEGKNKILNESNNNSEDNISVLILYNIGILKFKKQLFEESLKSFTYLLEFCNSNTVYDDDAAVLNYIDLNENGEMILIEVREGDKKITNIKCTVLAENNISILKNAIGI